MIGKLSIVSRLAGLLLIIPAVLLSQSSAQKHTLIINGRSTEVPLIQVNGHAYVGLEALASALKGTFSPSGNMIALSVPAGSANGASATSVTTTLPASPHASDQTASASSGF